MGGGEDVGGEVEPGARATPPGRCPYCRDAIAGTSGVVACAACGARHHAACWGELAACATCRSTEALVSARAASAARRRPPPLPRGSELDVRLDEAPGAEPALVVSWPFLTAEQARQARGCSTLLGVSALAAAVPALALWGFGVAAVVLLALSVAIRRWLARHGDARCVLLLGPDRLVFTRPGSPMERLRVEASRAEVRSVGRGEQGAGLEVQAGGDARSWIHGSGLGGGGGVLPGEDVRWVHDLLAAWRLDVLELALPAHADAPGGRAPSGRARAPTDKEVLPAEAGAPADDEGGVGRRRAAPGPGD